MNFTSRDTIGPVAGGILGIVMALNGWTTNINLASTRTGVAFAAPPEAFQPDEQPLIVAAMMQTQAPAPQAVQAEHQHAKASPKKKHWLKKNAPIIGGAGGGAIIGGLAGGGAGAIIGGAAGGGGGYLYKRHKQNQHHEYPRDSYQHEHH